VVARDGLVEHRVARRANAIVLLNDGWNCEEVGSALLLTRSRRSMKAGATLCLDRRRRLRDPPHPAKSAVGRAASNAGGS
jgi:hypothetical protein